MPSVELKFVPVGYVNPKSQTGKTQRFTNLSPLNFASRESRGKFYMVFSITGQGGNQLSIQAYNQDNTLVYNGKRMIGAIAKAGAKAGVDISTGLWLEAQEAIDITEFEPGIATKSIHGKAVVVSNNTEVSNVVTFSMDRTGYVAPSPTIGSGFERGQAYQAPAELAVVSGTKPFEKPPRVSVFQPAVTEEVIVDAEPGVTLDSIVSGITQAVTVQEAAAEPLASVLPPPTLSQETKKIIDDWSTKKIIVPNWFANNNINWVLQGKISEEEFIAGYTNLLNTGVITIPTTIPTTPPPPPPPIDTSTSLTMISQKWDYFDIVDGRAKGQITFRATSDFNPYYYGKELVNYMQLVNNQGLTIVLKPNVLRFTQTEQDETIQYDEGVGDLKSVKVESYVWTHDNKPMSSLYEFPIYDGKPPGTGTGELARTDFLAKIGGVLAGSIAIALLLPKRIGN